MKIKEAIRLALLKKVPRFYHPPEADQAPASLSEARILLIRPDHLGDVLLTTPTLKALRTALPRAHIAYMIGPWSKTIVQNNAYIDEMLTCPFPGFTRRPKGHPFAPYLLLWHEAKQLQEKGFHVAVNLRFDFWWGALLAYRAAIPLRFGHDTAEAAPFLTHAIPYKSGRHEVQQNLSLIEALLGQPVSRSALEFFPSEHDQSSVDSWLPRSPTGPLVVIHPGTGAPIKQWTAKGFARVADALVERWDARVIITGMPSELTLVQRVSRAMTKPSTMCVGLTVGQLGALFRHSDLVIGVDSGALHLAVAMGTRTVHLYGPTDIASFGPWGDPRRHRAVKSDLPCIPCNRLDYPPRHLREHPCVISIVPQHVLVAADKLLAKFHPTAPAVESKR
ncbi:MAG: glycosyltransferase family 9 protein [Chloroflexi bacterium]|nr:glycosyltransferase family 9 protein [Chloroflexota bacterium]